MPFPPFPNPNDGMLKVLIQEGMKAFKESDGDIRLTVLHVIVHAWMEGHIEGHTCPGCSHGQDEIAMAVRASLKTKRSPSKEKQS